MAEDKRFVDKNAHERTPADTSKATPSAEERERAAEKTDKEEHNPLSRLRFGSAGSGGAEREPGPERP